MPSVSRAAGLIISVAGLALVLLLSTYRFYAQAVAELLLDAEPRLTALASPMPASAQLSHASQPPRQRPPSQLSPTAVPGAAGLMVEAAEPPPGVSGAHRLNHSASGDMPEPDAPTRLEIPDLKLVARVRFVPFQGNTWDVSGLGQDVGWLGSRDGGQSNQGIVLAGHITVAHGDHGPFRYLSRLEPGALIRLHTQRQIYTYRIIESFIVEPEDSEVIAGRPNSELTLITCVNWDEATKTYLRRRVVVARLISPESQAGTRSD